MLNYGFLVLLPSIIIADLPCYKYLLQRGGQKVTSTVGYDWQISIHFVSFLQVLLVVIVVMIDGSQNLYYFELSFGLYRISRQ